MEEYNDEEEQNFFFKNHSQSEPPQNGQAQLVQAENTFAGEQLMNGLSGFMNSFGAVYKEMFQGESPQKEENQQEIKPIIEEEEEDKEQVYKQSISKIIASLKISGFLQRKVNKRLKRQIGLQQLMLFHHAKKNSELRNASMQASQSELGRMQELCLELSKQVETLEKEHKEEEKENFIVKALMKDQKELENDIAQLKLQQQASNRDMKKELVEMVSELDKRVDELKHKEAPSSELEKNYELIQEEQLQLQLQMDSLEKFVEKTAEENNQNLLRRQLDTLQAESKRFKEELLFLKQGLDEKELKLEEDLIEVNQRIDQKDKKVEENSNQIDYMKSQVKDSRILSKRVDDILKMSNEQKNKQQIMLSKIEKYERQFLTKDNTELYQLSSKDLMNEISKIKSDGRVEEQEETFEKEGKQPLPNLPVENQVKQSVTQNVEEVVISQPKQEIAENSEITKTIKSQIYNVQPKKPTLQLNYSEMFQTQPKAQIFAQTPHQEQKLVQNYFRTQSNLRSYYKTNKNDVIINTFKKENPVIQLSYQKPKEEIVNQDQDNLKQLAKCQNKIESKPYFDKFCKVENENLKSKPELPQMDGQIYNMSEVKKKQVKRQIDNLISEEEQKFIVDQVQNEIKKQREKKTIVLNHPEDKGQVYTLEETVSSKKPTNNENALNSIQASGIQEIQYNSKIDQNMISFTQFNEIEDIMKQISPQNVALNNTLQSQGQNMGKSITIKKSKLSQQGSPKEEALINQLEEDDDEEVLYLLDDEGYLMDENNNYILDDQGLQVKLTNEHIEYLKQSNMYEEKTQETL